MLSRNKTFAMAVNTENEASRTSGVPSFKHYKLKYRSAKVHIGKCKQMPLTVDEKMITHLHANRYILLVQL
jgi:hypothetical protein